MVTAASEGLGYACALRLAEAGCRIAICGRRADVLQTARAEIERRAGTEVHATAADLARAEQLEAFVRETTRRFDRLDVLVVNTGHVPYGQLDDLREDDWYGAFELVLMSAIRLCRLVAPVMRAQGSGDIVVITSATVQEPATRLLLSSVMRAGVAALAK